MSDTSMERGGPASTPSVAPPTTIAGRQCPQCDYALEGLPEVGACPECGAGYTLETTMPLRPPPGAWKLVLLLFAPFVVMLAFGMFFGAMSGPGSYGPTWAQDLENLGLLLFWLLMGAGLIWGFVLVGRRFGKLRRRRSWRSRRVALVVGAILWLLAYPVAMGAAFFGGCVVTAG